MNRDACMYNTCTESHVYMCVHMYVCLYTHILYHMLILINLMQLACNAHTICDNELRPLGTGLYPVISIINHRFIACIYFLYYFFLLKLLLVNSFLRSKLEKFMCWKYLEFQLFAQFSFGIWRSSSFCPCCGTYN